MEERNNYNICDVRVLGDRRRAAPRRPGDQRSVRHARAAADDADGRRRTIAVERVAHEIARLTAEEDGLAAIVVGLPARLDGSAERRRRRESPRLSARLRSRTPMPIHRADERLTSREAESRLALRERDWRKRKAAGRGRRGDHPAGLSGSATSEQANRTSTESYEELVLVAARRSS